MLGGVRRYSPARASLPDFGIYSIEECGEFLGVSC